MSMIQVLRETTVAQVLCTNPIGVMKYRPFFFTAILDQTVFELPTAAQPDGFMVLCIGGVFQSQAKGDFTVDGKIVTLDEECDFGDQVYGIYAEVPESENVLAFESRPFYFTASAGQSVFNLPSTPRENGNIVVAVDGIMQSPENGSYTLVGNVITFNASLTLGQEVSGIYEETN